MRPIWQGAISFGLVKGVKEKRKTRKKAAAGKHK